MAGRKLFTNNSPYGMAVTLLVRASEDPRNQAGSEEFFLESRQSRWHEYGNHIDIYLNGINLVATTNGEIVGQQRVVITRGSALDDALNTRNAVDFDMSNGVFEIHTRQV